LSGTIFYKSENGLGKERGRNHLGLSRACDIIKEEDEGRKEEGIQFRTKESESETYSSSGQREPEERNGNEAHLGERGYKGHLRSYSGQMEGSVGKRAKWAGQQGAKLETTEKSELKGGEGGWKSLRHRNREF